MNIDWYIWDYFQNRLNIGDMWFPIHYAHQTIIDKSGEVVGNLKWCTVDNLQIQGNKEKECMISRNQQTYALYISLFN